MSKGIWKGNKSRVPDFCGCVGAFAAVRFHGAVPDAGEPLVRFGMVTDVHYADKDPDPKPCASSAAGSTESRCASWTPRSRCSTPDYIVDGILAETV